MGGLVGLMVVLVVVALGGDEDVVVVVGAGRMGNVHGLGVHRRCAVVVRGRKRRERWCFILGCGCESESCWFFF